MKSMSLMKKILFIGLLALILIATSWVAVHNYQAVIKLQSEGKQPITVATPLAGQDGRDGEDATPEQIYRAVSQYCERNNCGDVSYQEIALAVMSYCSGGKCTGEQGADGKDAKEITQQQIQNAVVSYCSSGACRGADGQSIKGDTGAVGPAGAIGPRGEGTDLGCVIRQVNGSQVKYISWKYISEPTSAYRDLYKLPTWAECTNPIMIGA